MLTFVLGTGRCGSTLAAELIARHTDVGFVSNFDDKFGRLDLKGRWNNTLFNHSSERDPSLRPFRDRRRPIERGRLRVAPSEGWEVLEKQISSVFPQPCRDLTADDAMPWLQRRITNFFDSRMAAQGKPVFMHHLTGWPRSGLLSASYPEARYVHVIRDGRAVANSWLQMGWWDGYRGPENWYLGPLAEADRQVWEETGRSFVVLAGLGWKVLIEALEQARESAPDDQWLDVRMEDLIEDPRGQTSRILAFLGLTWDRQYESGFGRHTFQASRGQAWKRDLRTQDISDLERVIAEPLERYGYPLIHGQQPA
ncbi:MAG: sulfotransferase [Nocardioidaceae bacterium]